MRSQTDRNGADQGRAEAREELRRIASMAAPVALGGLGLVGMGAVDVAVVGRLGEQPLAALASGNLWCFGILVPAQFALSAMDPVVSQAVGAGDREGAGRALVRALVLTLAISVPAIWLQRQAGVGLALLGQPESVLPLAQRWCELSAWSTPFMIGFFALRSWLQAHGIVRPATVVILAANVLNLVLNLGLVLGWFGMPALGALGSAHATNLARAATFVGLALACRGALRESWPRGAGVLALGPTLRLLWLGLPGVVQMALEVWAFQAAALMMGWIGETALAANAIVLNLASLSFMAPLGVSSAGSARVGNLLGAGQPWGRAAWLTVGLGAAVMLFFAGVFLFFPRGLVAIYTDAPEVAAVAVSLLPVVAAFQIFDGTQVSCLGALRGAGDLKVPALTGLIGYWALGLPMAWVLAFRLELGPRGVWSGLAIGLATVAFLLLWRLRTTIARGGRRLQLDPDAPEL